jgi:hypothetical protein
MLLHGLGAKRYDLLINPLRSSRSTRSAMKLCSRKEVISGSNCDFVLPATTLIKATIKPVDARTGHFLRACQFKILSSLGEEQLFAAQIHEGVSSFQFLAQDGLQLQVIHPGYARIQRPIPFSPSGAVDFGELAMNSERGSFELTIHTGESRWKTLEIFIREEKSGVQLRLHRPLRQSIEKLKVLDLSPGPIVVTPYLRDGTWPQETVRKLKPIRRVIQARQQATETLKLPAFQ